MGEERRGEDESSMLFNDTFRLLLYPSSLARALVRTGTEVVSSGILSGMKQNGMSEKKAKGKEGTYGGHRTSGERDATRARCG